MKRQSRRSRARYSGRSTRHRWVPLLAGGLILAVIVVLHAYLRPIVQEVAGHHAKVYAARIVNESLLSELDTSDIAYNELVFVTQNADGLVTSIQSDVVAINRLKARMVRGIVQDLEALELDSIHLPLGTLLGSEWLSGRGPMVEIRIMPMGYVQSELYNSFTSAGINQTHHQVMLRTTVQMSVIIPGYHIQVETTTNFCIAETIIVGTIPDAVIQFATPDIPTVAKIGD